MSNRPVWLNDVERDAFIETQCRRCFEPHEAMKRVAGAGPGCPHLLRAEDGKLPKAWTLRRTATMGETYRCADQMKKPPVNRRKTVDDETPPMFDAPAEPIDFVPVEGWPSAADFGKTTKDEKGDHA